MELLRGSSGKELLWKVKGDLDDDSALEFESMVLNSEYGGEDMVLDLSDLRSASIVGRKSIDRVLRSARNRGARVKVLPPSR